MHCWHQKVAVARWGSEYTSSTRPARSGDRYADVFVDTAKSRAVHEEWKRLTEPAHGPLRRPLWMNRPRRPGGRGVSVLMAAFMDHLLMEPTTLDPTLPPSWREWAIERPSAGPDSRWQDNARELLRKHGSAALVVADVQDLVRLATGGTTGSMLSEERIARIPDPAWAIDQVWSDRGVAGCLWAASEDLRSIDAELSVLTCLRANGFDLVHEATRHERDWTVTRDGHSYSIEVKAKGGQEAKLDYVHRAFVGQQLVDQSDLLRRCRVSCYPMGDALDGARSGHLHWLAKTLASAAPQIAEQMPQTWKEVPLDVGEGGAVLLAEPNGWKLKLKSADGWRIHLTATMDSTAWTHDYLRPHPGHVARRLPAERQEEVASMLAQHVCYTEDEFATSESLYVVLWPVPSTWDATLADNEEIVDRILELMTRELEARRGSMVPIALWGESSGRFGGRMRLNAAAEALLGARTLGTRAS